MIEVCAIASGSNGNCYYTGNEHEAILIDAGISAKQIILRMETRNLEPSKLKAVFLTHEHVDHVRGCRVLSKKLNIPVFYTYGTWNKTHKSSRASLYRYIYINKPLQMGAFTVHAFAKQHDANEPCSYRIETGNHNIGIMTDIGSVCENVIANFQQCDVVFLESNYDEKMLWNGSYPWPLKKRITSDVGHLSNKQALELVQQHATNELKTIFLSHLSGENNTPEIAYENFKPLHKTYNIIKTLRHDASEVLCIKTN